jgi:hypothetical protein
MRYLRFNGIIIYFTTKTTKILSSGVHFNAFMAKKKITTTKIFLGCKLRYESTCIFYLLAISITASSRGLALG